MIKPWLTRFFLMTFVAALAGPLMAATETKSEDIYIFNNAELTMRFNALSQVLRCPKCQDQNIGDSDAEIASDMRRKTAQLLRDGYTNEQIVAYFVERYGDFVTYDPPVRKDTIWLWAAPLIAFLIGLLLVIVQMTKAHRRLQDDTTNNEEAQ